MRVDVLGVDMLRGSLRRVSGKSRDVHLVRESLSLYIYILIHGFNAYGNVLWNHAFHCIKTVYGGHYGVRH